MVAFGGQSNETAKFNAGEREKLCGVSQISNAEEINIWSVFQIIIAVLLLLNMFFVDNLERSDLWI